jgi:D-glycero-alpha-D-manno-heptose 1-phosphate guanylyltransferase
MMPVKEAIILAGGLGTRLRDEVPDLPKCLAPVNEKPFLHYLILFLKKAGIERFIFSLGYKADAAITFIAANLSPAEYSLVIEPEPLGTGGAIRLAMESVKGEHVWVLNGDSISMVNLAEQYRLHTSQAAICTLALIPQQQFDRYGTVTIDQNNRITGFAEKQWQENGLINAGIYLLHKNTFLQSTPAGNFSMETEFLQRFYPTLPMYGYVEAAYFIDIGVPADYRRAQQEFSQLFFSMSTFELTQADHSWTIFLDRDGVINHDKDNDYIRHVGEFVLYENTLNALRTLSQLFHRVIIVTNQKGVGRGLMTLEDLNGIHDFLLQEVSKSGGRIDKIYFCSDIDNDSPNRKPNPGMAFQARAAFPDIDLAKSMVAGNRLSDMEFGRNAGMHTVFIATTHPEVPFPDERIDLRYNSLYEFSEACRQQMKS